MDVFLLFLAGFGCVFCEEPAARFLWNGHVTLEGGVNQGHNETVGGDDITGEAKVNVGVHYDAGDDKWLFTDFINKFVEGDNATGKAEQEDDANDNRVGNIGLGIKRNCADVQLITTYVSALLKKRGIIREDLKLPGGGSCSSGFINVANGLIIKSLKMLVGPNQQLSTNLRNTTAIIAEADKTFNTIKMLLQKPTCQNGGGDKNVATNCQLNNQKNVVIIISRLLEYLNMQCGGCFTKTQIFFDSYGKTFRMLAMMMRLIRGDQIAWTQTSTLDALKTLVGIQTVKSTKTSENTQKVAMKGEINGGGAKLGLAKPVVIATKMEDTTKSNGTTPAPS